MILCLEEVFFEAETSKNQASKIQVGIVVIVMKEILVFFKMMMRFVMKIDEIEMPRLMVLGVI